MESLTFKAVTKSNRDIDCLFDFLKQRGSHAISHKKVPDFQRHAEFVRKHPYRHWFIIFRFDVPIGTAYIGFENCVGIFLLDWQLEVVDGVLRKIMTMHKPLPPIPSVRPGHFYINVSPNNTALLEIIEQLGLSQIQTSFAISK